jgi:hypothetical protein
MRATTVPVVAVLAVLASAAFAQTSAPNTGAPAPAAPTPYTTGPLPEIDTGGGRVIVEPDGSTKTVKAAPCGRAARETDGSTTCVGIPDAGANTGR